VDLGYLYAGKAALQAAVDAGALGGASGLPDTATAQGRVIQIGGANKVFQTPADLDPATSNSTIEFGTYSSGAFTVSGSGINALRVTGQMSLPLFFAPAIGINTANISAQALAVMQNSNPFACGGIFAEDEFDISVESGAFTTDSFNSNAGPYNPATAGSNGSVCSCGEMRLPDSETGPDLIIINGNVTYGQGSNFATGPGLTVNGSITPWNPSTCPMPTINVGNAATNNDNGSIGLTTNGNNPLSGPNFLIQNNDTITLGSGTYYFQNFHIKSNSTLFVNPTSGPVIIFVTTNLKVKGGGSIVNQSQLPPNLRIHYTGTGEAVLKGWSNPFHGYITATTGKLDINAGADFYGAFATANIDFLQLTTGGFHYDEALETTNIPEVKGSGAGDSAFLGG
ncbi:MAG: TadG family pilus assembly protein, partial [Nitrospinota bacterium]